MSEELCKRLERASELLKEVRGFGQPSLYLEAAARIRDLEGEVEQYSDAFRSLALGLSAGGLNADTMTPDLGYEKVKWGIDDLTEKCGALRAERDRLLDDAECMALVREHGMEIERDEEGCWEVAVRRRYGYGAIASGFNLNQAIRRAALSGETGIKSPGLDIEDLSGETGGEW